MTGLFKNQTRLSICGVTWAVLASCVLALPIKLMAQSEVIEFPEDELAQESVLPIFDKMEVVKNRRVTTAGKFEFGGGLGVNLTEALYKNQETNVSVTYNLTNIHAINFTGIFIDQGLSNMGTDLAAGKGLIDGQKFDASQAPSLQSLSSLNYVVTTYYGKISLTKRYVINLSLYGVLGLSQVTFSDTSSVGLNVGVGQKFYLNPWLGLKIDLLMNIFQGPDPISAPRPLTSTVSSSQLDERTYFNTYLNFGLVFIL